MYVATAVQDIEYLAGLGDGAKQRIVTAGSFVLFIVAHRRTLSVTFGALHTAIEIHGHGLKGFLLQPLQNQVTVGFLLQGYTVIIKLREYPANGRHTGQRFETQNAFN
jgi:hypothetical protein